MVLVNKKVKKSKVVFHHRNPSSNQPMKLNFGMDSSFNTTWETSYPPASLLELLWQAMASYRVHLAISAISIRTLMV